MKLIFRWILNALALLSVAYLVDGIQVESFWVALIAALVIGLVNILIKPILLMLTLPITLITLGLFIFVINGLLFWGVGNVLQGFVVTSLKAGIIGALVYSVLSWVLTAIVIDDD